LAEGKTSSLTSPIPMAAKSVLYGRLTFYEAIKVDGFVKSL
jgi:hypothetical protein